MPASPATRRRLVWALLAVCIGATTLHAQDVVIPSRPSGGHTSYAMPFPGFLQPHRSITLDIDVKPDGSEVRTWRVRERALEVASLNYALEVPFDGYRGALTFDDVRVIDPVGRVQNIEARQQVEDVTPRMAWWGRYFATHHARVPVGNVGALDTVEYTYRQTRTPLFSGETAFEADWVSTWFAREGAVTLRLPPGRSLLVKSRRSTPKVAVEDGRQVYRWTFTRDSEYASEGRLTPVAAESAWARPDVQVSSFESWGAVGEAIRTVWGKVEAPTARVQAKARELTANRTVEQDRIEALYRYVALEVENLDSLSIVGEAPPQTPDEVILQNKGTGIEKHTLLEALLRSTGIRSTTALVSAGGFVDREVPSPVQFNHALTVVDTSTGPLWLDTRLATAPLGYLQASERGAIALLVPDAAAPRLVTTPVTPVRENRVTWRGEGAFDRHGVLAVRAHVTFSGHSELAIRRQLLVAPDSPWWQIVDGEIMADQPGGQVVDVQAPGVRDFTRPLEVTYTFIPTPSVRRWTGSAIEIPFPEVWRHYSEWGFREPQAPDIPAGTGSTGRLVGVVGVRTFDLRIEVPAGARGELADSRDLRRTEVSDFASFEQRITINNGVLIATRTLSVMKPAVAAGRDAEVSSFVRRVTEPYPVLVIREQWPWRSTTVPRLEDATGADARASQLVAQAVAAPPMVALGLLEQALTIEPLHPRAWSLLGEKQLDAAGLTNQFETSMRRQIEVAPSASAYKRFGLALTKRSTRFEDAVPVYREGMTRFPDDRDLPAMLGEALLRINRPEEAATVLEAETARRPRSSRLRSMLGRAWLLTGRIEDGVAEVATSVALENTPDMQIAGARSLVDAGAHLGFARQLALQALSTAAPQVRGLTFATPGAANIQNTFRLTYFMETLGRVLVTLGDFDDGERYCRAAYEVGQRKLAAACLADVAAARQDRGASVAYRTIATFPVPDPLPDGTFDTATTQQVSPTPSSQMALREIRAQQMRRDVIDVPRPAPGAGQATVEVITDPDAVIREVRFMQTPPPAYYVLMASLLDVTFGPQLPDDVPARLLRRAAVTCGANDLPTCQMRIIR